MASPSSGAALSLMACGPATPTLMGDHPAALGIAALRKGDVAAALAHFEALIVAEPNGVPGHFLRVQALDQLGRLAEVREALQGLVTRYPFAEGACRERLALLALREGDADQALLELEKARSCGWTNAAAIRTAAAFQDFAQDPRFVEILGSADSARS